MSDSPPKFERDDDDDEDRRAREEGEESYSSAVGAPPQSVLDEIYRGLGLPYGAALLEESAAGYRDEDDEDDEDEFEKNTRYDVPDEDPILEALHENYHPTYPPEQISFENTYFREKGGKVRGRKYGKLEAYLKDENRANRANWRDLDLYERYQACFDICAKREIPPLDLWNDLSLFSRASIVLYAVSQMHIDEDDPNEFPRDFEPLRVGVLEEISDKIDACTVESNDAYEKYLHALGAIEEAVVVKNVQKLVNVNVSNQGETEDRLREHYISIHEKEGPKLLKKYKDAMASIADLEEAYKNGSVKNDELEKWNHVHADVEEILEELNLWETMIFPEEIPVFYRELADLVAPQSEAQKKERLKIENVKPERDGKGLTIYEEDVPVDSDRKNRTNLRHLSKWRRTVLESLGREASDDEEGGDVRDLAAPPPPPASSSSSSSSAVAAVSDARARLEALKAKRAAAASTTSATESHAKYQKLMQEGTRSLFEGASSTTTRPPPSSSSSSSFSHARTRPLDEDED